MFDMAGQPTCKGDMSFYVDHNLWAIEGYGDGVRESQGELQAFSEGLKGSIEVSVETTTSYRHSFEQRKGVIGNKNEFHKKIQLYLY